MQTYLGMYVIYTNYCLELVYNVYYALQMFLFLVAIMFLISHCKIFLHYYITIMILKNTILLLLLL